MVLAKRIEEAEEYLDYMKAREFPRVQGHTIRFPVVMVFVSLVLNEV